MRVVVVMIEVEVGLNGDLVSLGMGSRSAAGKEAIADKQ